MDWQDYPRPPDDNGLGLHWSASIYHDTPLGNWDFWEKELLAMGIKWVKLLDDGGGSSLKLCEKLLAAGIMPVVRLYRPQPNPGRIGGREKDTIKRLLQLGVRYFQTNNEPNLPIEWQGNRRPGRYAEIVAENWHIEAQEILHLGGFPIAPPWAPAFEPESYRCFLERLKELGAEDVFKSGACLGSHNYRHRHPTNYPYDEIQQQSHPGCSVLDDSLTFLNWLWVLENFRRVFDFYVPVFCLEGGPVIPFQADDRYPALNRELHAKYVIEEVEFMLGRVSIPIHDSKLGIDELHISREPASWLFCTAWWLAGNYIMGHLNPVWEGQVWYFADGSHLPCVDRLKELPHKRELVPVQPVPIEVPAPAPQPPPSQWVMEVTREPGLRLLICRLPEPGIPVQVFDPWGNYYEACSGTKPEYGPGACEIPLWADGIYEIHIPDGIFRIEILNCKNIVTFTKRPVEEERLGRIETDWLPESVLEGLVAQLNQNPNLKDKFRVTWQ